jgi:hypothetical protein
MESNKIESDNLWYYSEEPYSPDQHPPKNQSRKLSRNFYSLVSNNPDLVILASILFTTCLIIIYYEYF